jgi:Ca2+-binding EF-hand superfamily protein
MDLNNDGYVDYREFLTGLLRIYCSTFEQRTKFVFEIYDFDEMYKILDICFEGKIQINFKEF